MALESSFNLGVAPYNPYTGPPVTLASMRSHGVRHVVIYCGNAAHCWHRGRMNLDAWPDDMALKAIERRFVCTQCGLAGEADARPDWSEVPQRESWCG